MWSTHFLFLNPNTSQVVSEVVRNVLQRSLVPGESVHVETALSGVPYIGTPEAMHLGTLALRESARRCLSDTCSEYDAIVLACFADLGTDALAQECGLPVISLLGAAIEQAGTLGTRWSVVTAGKAWASLLPGMVLSSPQFSKQGQLVSVRTFELSTPRSPETEATVRAEVAKQAALCASEDRADVVIIGGAGLGGLAWGLSETLGIPVIDSVLSGLEVIRARLLTQRSKDQPKTGQLQDEDESSRMKRYRVSVMGNSSLPKERS